MNGRDGLKRAIEIAGGQGSLSRAIGVPQSLISYWLHKSRRGIAAEKVLEVESVTGVSRRELRPDIYTAPDQHSGASGGAA